MSRHVPFSGCQEEEALSGGLAARHVRLALCRALTLMASTALFPALACSNSNPARDDAPRPTIAAPAPPPISTNPADYADTPAMRRASDLSKAYSVSERDLDWLEQAIRLGKPGVVHFASIAVARQAPKRAVELFEELGFESFSEATVNLGPEGIPYVLKRMETGKPHPYYPVLLSLLIENNPDSEEAKTAVPTLLRWLLEPAPLRNAFAVRALGAFKAPESLILPHAAAEDPILRRGAVRGLGALPSRSAKAEEVLTTATKDKDKEVRAEAKEALRKR